MNYQRFCLLFNGLRFIGDIILIPIIIVIAYALKFKLGWIADQLFHVKFGEIYQHAQIEPYFSLVLAYTLLISMTFYALGLYGKRALIFPAIEDFLKIIKGVTIVCIEVMALTFLVNDFFPESRYMILYVWFFSILVFTLSRSVIHQIQLTFLKKGYGSRRALVLGSNTFAQDLIEKMIIYPSLGLQYVGTLADGFPDKLHFYIKDKYVSLGRICEYRDICDTESIEVIFYMLDSKDDNDCRELFDFCQREGIELKFLSDSVQIYTGALYLENIDGLPFIPASIPDHSYKLEYKVKRFIDITVSLCVLILWMPLLILIALSIFVVSPGQSVIYRQDRVGKNRKIFKMLKFRTMIPNAESLTGPVMVKEKEEDRTHSLGKFLRKTSLDELPQFWNILKGEMSLIGPRPERPFFVEKFEKNIPHFGLRHHVKGGLTGWAQINGRSRLTNRPDYKIKYDLYYIYNWSLMLDIKIFLRTIWVVLRREEAY